MTFFRGRLPSLIIVFALNITVVANAQHNVPLTLAEAEDQALEAEPGQAALRASAIAFEEQAVVAGQLPDPTLHVGLLNYPISSGSFSTEGMTQAQLGIRQSFPAGKSRSFGTRRLQSLALEMTENAAARSRSVLMRVRQAWLEAHYWQRARDIVTESRPFFADLVTVTRSLYAVGSKTQQDVLRADLELSRLDDRLIDIERRNGQAKAVLSEWLGSDANRPIAEKPPSWDSVPALATLQNNLLSHPMLLAADAEIAARRAGVGVAEELKKPGWAVDLGYGYRDGTLPSGEPRSDFVSLSVSVDLPFFQKNRQDRSLTAALNEQSASQYRKRELERHLGSELGAEFAHWQELTRRIVLYETRILALSSEQANAALLAYQSESGDFADVMHGYIDDLNTRLDYLRLQVERDQSYAVLANLGGLSR